MANLNTVTTKEILVTKEETESDIFPIYRNHLEHDVQMGSLWETIEARRPAETPEGLSRRTLGWHVQGPVDIILN